MKINAESGAFSKALSIVTRAAAKKTTVVQLGAVLIEAKDGVLTFKATDNEISIALRSSAKIEEEGAAAIPARMISEIASQLKEQPITLSADDSGATLSTESASYTLRCHDPKEFPVLPEFDKDSAFSVPAREFSKAIARASAAVDNDETRPILSGLLASFSGGSLTMASPDSYRLALHKGDLGSGPSADRSAGIPARALAEVGRLAEMDEEISVVLGENQAMFKAKSIVLSTRLIDGNFPEYSRLLPESFEMEFDVPAQALRESLKRANLFSGASERSSKGSTGGSPGAPVRFAFCSEEGTLTGGRLTISSKSADTGEAAESLEATVPEGAEEFVVAFNGRYIAEGVHEIIATGVETVRFKANEALKPVVLCPAPASGKASDGSKDSKEPPDYTYLIMPMRDPDSAGKES